LLALFCYISAIGGIDGRNFYLNFNYSPKLFKHLYLLKKLIVKLTEIL